MATSLPPSVLDGLGLTGNEEGEQQILCPFHDDHDPSAYVNMETGLFYCHVCGASYNATQLEDKLGNGFEAVKAHVPETVQPLQQSAGIVPTVEEIIVARGFDLDDDIGMELRIDDGYLHFGDTGVARNMMMDQRPRYLNTKGAAPLVLLGDVPEPGEAVWLVEGIFDAMSLRVMMPGAYVGAALGDALSDAQCYALKGLTVFLMFDADHAGYKGARATAEKLKEYDANPLILDFPAGLGKDPNLAFCQNRDALDAWLMDMRAEYATRDDAYVYRTFSNPGNLPRLSTSVDTWDTYLHGGFAPGVHVVGAESAVGKTSWATAFATAAAEAGSRVLLITYEIPKRQQWARIASRYTTGLVDMSWAEIEADPLRVPDDVKKHLEVLAKRMRVAVGWTVQQIKYASKHYDTIVVDYLQRMPAPFRGDKKKANVDHNISELSNIARDRNIPVVVISSLNRDSYDRDQITKRAFKESGDIEYVAQSLTGLRRADDSPRVFGSIVKNTRGAQGHFFMEFDMAHQTVTVAKPWDVTQRAAKRKTFDTASAVLGDKDEKA
jgi:hypothetical protein